MTDDAQLLRVELLWLSASQVREVQARPDGRRRRRGVRRRGKRGEGLLPVARREGAWSARSTLAATWRRSSPSGDGLRGLLQSLEQWPDPSHLKQTMSFVQSRRKCPSSKHLKHKPAISGETSLLGLTEVFSCAACPRSLTQRLHISFLVGGGCLQAAASGTTTTSATGGWGRAHRL